MPSALVSGLMLHLSLHDNIKICLTTVCGFLVCFELTSCGHQCLLITSLRSKTVVWWFKADTCSVMERLLIRVCSLNSMSISNIYMYVYTQHFFIYRMPIFKCIFLILKYILLMWICLLCHTHNI